MHAQAIEVALDHDRRFAACGCRALDIEQFPCLAKSGRKLVLRQLAVRRPAGIGYQFTAGIADRDHDAPTHQARPAVEPHAKLGGGDPVNAPLLQVGGWIPICDTALGHSKPCLPVSTARIGSHLEETPPEENNDTR
jgi:hypothetical protein